MSTRGKEASSRQLQMRENFRWGTRESLQRDVADILNVLHPFFGRIEAASSQVSKLGEELGRWFELRLCLGGMANVIANLVFLSF